MKGLTGKSPPSDDAAMAHVALVNADSPRAAAFKGIGMAVTSSLLTNAACGYRVTVVEYFIARGEIMRRTLVVTALAVALGAILYLSRPPTMVPAQTLPKPAPTLPVAKLPDKDFTHPPEKPHSVTDLFFTFDQLEHWYRVPGEFTYRLTGDQYGFDALSFIISETHPGGGPGLHTHNVEEAHVLLEGTIEYRIGDKTFTVQAPYVARVPAGVPHTFINAGDKPFNLIAVFPSKHPISTRIGPNPLIPAGQNKEEPRSAPIP